MVIAELSDERKFSSSAPVIWNFSKRLLANLSKFRQICNTGDFITLSMGNRKKHHTGALLRRLVTCAISLFSYNAVNLISCLNLLATCIPFFTLFLQLLLVLISVLFTGCVHFRRNALRFALLGQASPIFVRSTRNQLLEYLENRLTQNHQIVQRHPYRHCLQPYQICVIICFQSEVVAKNS